MATIPNTAPTYRTEIADLLESYNQHKADELAAKVKADGVKAQIENLLIDCDMAHVAGYELARVQLGVITSWDTASLLRLCDALRQTDNNDTADAIIAVSEEGCAGGLLPHCRHQGTPKASYGVDDGR
ncbi:MAG: hypothetical protein H0X37_21315 [Herpetosiphonaceae bacterium]|nr:hypothetical protein [Herpetosiphonaceae bacterium]